MKKVIEMINESGAKKFRVVIQYGIYNDSVFNEYRKVSRAEAIKQVKAFYKELFKRATEGETMPESYLIVYDYERYYNGGAPFIDKHFKEN